MSASFWNLAPPGSVRGRAQWDGTVDVEGPIQCSTNPMHMRPGKRSTDLSVVLTAKPTADFVWTWVSECLIQDRVLQFFQQQGFTGFEVKPVRVRLKRRAKGRDRYESGRGLLDRRNEEDLVPIFWELVVTGWAGMARPSSGVQLVNYCPTCRLAEYSCFTDPSQLIDESQWDGSDFVMVWPLPGFIFVSDRVALAIKRSGLRGAPVKPMHELTCEGGLSPGRLSYWMPDARARALGGPLGIY